jgi:hypothetical protein
LVEVAGSRLHSGSSGLSSVPVLAAQKWGRRGREKAELSGLTYMKIAEAERLLALALLAEEAETPWFPK